MGHSFGGGVAIRLAHDYPERVRSLVLVNSIGGSAWKRGKRLTSLAERPLWDWGLHLPVDMWPLRQATRVIPVVLEDAVPNLVRHPRSLWRVAQLARTRRPAARAGGAEAAGACRSRSSGPSATACCRGSRSTPCAWPPGPRAGWSTVATRGCWPIPTGSAR